MSEWTRGHPAQFLRARRGNFRLYQPLATTWRMYDNSDVAGMRLIAAGRGSAVECVHDEATWQRIRQEYSRGK